MVITVADCRLTILGTDGKSSYEMYMCDSFGVHGHWQY